MRLFSKQNPCWPLLLLAFAMLGGGCQDLDLPKVWRITYPRMLGMRVEVIGDPTRATPMPGERARMRLWVVGSKPVTQLSYAIEVCSALPPRTTAPGCAETPFDSEEGALPELKGRVDREVVLELEVPSADALEGVDQLLVAGTLCTDGDARVDLAGKSPGRCLDGAQPPVTFTAHIQLAREEGEYNRNPELVADAIQFDKKAWGTAGAAMADGLDASVGAADDAGIGNEGDAGVPSGSGAIPSVSIDGKKHDIRIDLEHSGRERTPAGREEMLLSQYVTVGQLENHYSVLERSQADSHALSVEWTSPKSEEAPEHGIAAFVLRDQRGGVAFALREIDIAHE